MNTSGLEYFIRFLYFGVNAGSEMSGKVALWTLLNCDNGILLSVHLYLLGLSTVGMRYVDHSTNFYIVAKGAIMLHIPLFFNYYFSN